MFVQKKGTTLQKMSLTRGTVQLLLLAGLASVALLRFSRAGCVAPRILAVLASLRFVAIDEAALLLFMSALNKGGGPCEARWWVLVRLYL